MLASVTATLSVLFGQLPGAKVYGPVALGDHVDHTPTRQAVARNGGSGGGLPSRCSARGSCPTTRRGSAAYVERAWMVGAAPMPA